MPRRTEKPRGLKPRLFRSPFHVNLAGPLVNDYGEPQGQSMTLYHPLHPYRRIAFLAFWLGLTFLIAWFPPVNTAVKGDVPSQWAPTETMYPFTGLMIAGKVRTVRLR